MNVANNDNIPISIRVIFCTIVLATNGNRTRDLTLTMGALYRLSYRGLEKNRVDTIAKTHKKSNSFKIKIWERYSVYKTIYSSMVKMIIYRFVDGFYTSWA